MHIHANFEGGNINVLRIEDDTIFLQNEMRDSKGDWFYWAFCVEGAQGKTLRFTFDKKWIGYYGAAVSHDRVNWHWSETATDDCTFTYTFGQDEDKVYFAHDLVYTPTRLFGFFGEMHLTPKTLCFTKKGRPVPMLTLGAGSKRILITSRHHACESTGTYIMEGFIREFLASPIDDVTLCAVPFVDCDGVYDGDQGKNRAPHDHNRDYTASPIYNETKAIMALADAIGGARMVLDCHSPNHLGGRSDNIFIVRKCEQKLPEFEKFCAILEGKCNENTLVYKAENDMPPNTAWNLDSSPTCAGHFNQRPDCKLGFSLETTYFGKGENKVSAEKLISTGRALCTAVKEYLSML